MSATIMPGDLPLTYAEAIVAISSRDPALAALLMHHHDCIEDVKRDGKANGRSIDHLRRDFRTAAISLLSMLAAWFAFVLWQVITHPHGFAAMILGLRGVG